MAAYQCGQNIYYRSFRDIDVDEELLVWYSDSYQKHLEIPLSLKATDQAKIEGMVIRNQQTETFYSLPKQYNKIRRFEFQFRPDF
jgi:hypothetical protein